MYCAVRVAHVCTVISCCVRLSLTGFPLVPLGSSVECILLLRLGASSLLRIRELDAFSSV